MPRSLPASPMARARNRAAAAAVGFFVVSHFYYRVPRVANKLPGP